MELCGFMAELAAGRSTDDDALDYSSLIFDGLLPSPDGPGLPDHMGMTYDECTEWINGKAPSQILADRIQLVSPDPGTTIYLSDKEDGLPRVVAPTGAHAMSNSPRMPWRRREEIATPQKGDVFLIATETGWPDGGGPYAYRVVRISQNGETVIVGTDEFNTLWTCSWSEVEWCIPVADLIPPE